MKNNNYSKQYWNDTKKSLHHNREYHRGCSMWREVGIPYMIKIGKSDELYDWEKEHFSDGVRDGKWDSKGNHLKDNNPYDGPINLTEP